MVQDAPGVTGVAMPPALIAELSRLDGVRLGEDRVAAHRAQGRRRRRGRRRTPSSPCSAARTRSSASRSTRAARSARCPRASSPTCSARCSRALRRRRVDRGPRGVPPYPAARAPRPAARHRLGGAQGGARRARHHRARDRALPASALDSTAGAALRVVLDELGCIGQRRSWTSPPSRRPAPSQPSGERMSGRGVLLVGGNSDIAVADRASVRRQGRRRRRRRPRGIRTTGVFERFLVADCAEPATAEQAVADAAGSARPARRRRARRRADAGGPARRRPPTSSGAARSGRRWTPRSSSPAPRCPGSASGRRSSRSPRSTPPSPPPACPPTRPRRPASRASCDSSRSSTARAASASTPWSPGCIAAHRHGRERRLPARSHRPAATRSPPSSPSSASDGASFVTGATIPVDGGLSISSPAAWLKPALRERWL